LCFWPVFRGLAGRRGGAAVAAGALGQSAGVSSETLEQAFWGLIWALVGCETLGDALAAFDSKE